MTDYVEALLKSVLESCRVTFPHEDVLPMHTLEHAVEVALAYSATARSMSDDEVDSYIQAAEQAMDAWVAAIPPEVRDTAVRRRVSLSTEYGRQSGVAPAARIDAYRCGLLDIINDASAATPDDDAAAVADLLGRLGRADSELEKRSDARRAEFIGRAYDLNSSDIDPARAQAVFRRMFDDHPELRVENLVLLKGLHSREVHFVDLVDGPLWRRSLVIRRDRNQNLTPGSVADEYEILRRLFDAGIPVPEPVGCSRDPDDLGRPFVVMERLDGRTLDLSTEPAASARMLDMAELLARYHGVPIDDLVAANVAGTSLERHYQDVIAYWVDAWRALGIHSFVVERAIRYLRNFPPDAGDRFCLVHGDYTARQILVDDRMVVGLLDFELAGPGCSAEDLAGIKAEAESVVSWDEFLARYYAADGPRVSDQTIFYFDIFVQFRNIVIVSRGSEYFQRGQIDDIHFGVMRVKWTPILFDMLQRSLDSVSDRSTVG